MYETSCQSRFDARYWMLGAGALGRLRGMIWGGRREEDSGWGTHVYLWRKNKIKLKKKKEIVFSPLYILATFVKYKLSIGVWIYLWAFYFVPLIYISVFVPVPYCPDDCSFVVKTEVRQVVSSRSILCSEDRFGSSRFFVFPYKL